MRTRVRCEALTASDGALQRLASLSQPPPLLPLTELLGDLAIRPEGQPLPLEAPASPELGIASQALEQQPFELRPSGTPTTSAELQTPRLVMRTGGKGSPSSQAEERLVLLRLSIVPSGDATREAGGVAVKLVLRQEPAAPMQPPSLPQPAMQQPLPAAGDPTGSQLRMPSRSLVPAEAPGRSAGLADNPSHAVGDGHADKIVAGGTNSFPRRNDEATTAAESRGAGNGSEHIADPFAAAAHALGTQGSAAIELPPAAALRSEEEAAAADGAAGLLDSDLEQVELQIAASMQPSSEGSGAAEKLLANGSHRSSRIPESGLGDAPSLSPAEEGAVSNQGDGGESRPVVALSNAGLEQDADAKPDADGGQPTPDDRENGLDLGLESADATTQMHQRSTTPSEPVALEAVSKESPAISVREEEASGALPAESAAFQEHAAAKEHADWEHVRHASDGDTDDSGVVVHHEHAAQVDDDALLPTERGTITSQGTGRSSRQVLEEGSPEAEAQSPEEPSVAAQQAHMQSEDAAQASGEAQQAPSQPSTSAAASEASSSAATNVRAEDRHATPERRQLFPRPAGDSSPGPSPSAVDWSQIGKKSGRFAAMAGDSLRKGFAQAASHASSAARHSGKGEPRALSPPAEKLQDQHSRRSITPPGREQQAGGPTFLQSLKSRGEQSLHAARSVLSPEATGHKADSAASGDGSPAAAEGPKAEHAALGSMRGMFSDLKRTMERVGRCFRPKQPFSLSFHGFAACEDIFKGFRNNGAAPAAGVLVRGGLLFARCAQAMQHH